MATHRFCLTAHFETVEDGWIQARITELPAVLTVAPTREQAEELLVDALHEYLLALGERDGGSVEGTGGETVPLEVAVG